MLARHSRNHREVREHTFDVFPTLQHQFTHQFTPLFTPRHRTDPACGSTALGAPASDDTRPDSLPPTSRPLICVAGHHSTSGRAFSSDLTTVETGKGARECRSSWPCPSVSEPADHTPHAERKAGPPGRQLDTGPGQARLRTNADGGER